MKTDWTFELIADICKGRIIKSGNSKITGFSKDTRSIEPGNVYIALSGENFDGHQFVNDAIKAGASGVIISNDIALPTDRDTFVIKVKDCLKALQNCATFYRESHKGFFIAITGSNGKTTTRAMLQHILSKNKSCYATSGNLNNHIGLPLTILATPNDADYIVLEMGMNHEGEIKELCNIAKPDMALICNIGPAHIGNLGTLENIARAKAEIFSQLKKDATAIAPSDTEFKNIFVQSTNANIIYFGIENQPDYSLSKIDANLESISFKIQHKSASYCCQLPLAGQHNAFNAMAALAACNQIGLDLEQCCQRLQSFKAVNARMEKFVKDGITILIDCYNANPASMNEALKYLNLCDSPRIAVLGDMKELGSHSETLHAQTGNLAAKLAIDFVITVGSEAAFISKAAENGGIKKENVFCLSSNEQAAELLKENLKTGATILFKASRGMHFEKIIRSIWPELAEDLH
ncbi:MAG: UDP-N-acetylmuramoyl-tripeptide--D-alanyl-D-alanine ligase [Candidatus Rifleibacteriota bacterium]